MVTERPNGENGKSVAVEQKESKLAEIASSYFITASREYPAFVLPQAARIAQLSRVSGIDHPFALLNPLVNNDHELEKIVIAGNTRHDHSGKGPKNEDNEIVELDKDGILTVIEADYRWAEVMTSLPDEILAQILAMYPVFSKLKISADTQAAEDWYGINITALMLNYFGKERYSELYKWAESK